MAIEDWVAENYDAIVADKNRGVTYEDLAKSPDAELAAWARGKVSRSGGDVTPKAAKSEGKSVRSDDK